MLKKCLCVATREIVYTFKASEVINPYKWQEGMWSMQGARRGGWGAGLDKKLVKLARWLGTKVL
jgi:hypothetical protein